MEAIKDVIINFIYTRYDIIIPCLWAIAVISPFIGIFWWTIRRSRKKISNFVVTITVCVLISVFLMRFGVGYYNNVSVDNGLPLPEVAGQCLIETFQTLTLDADRKSVV